jgi:hypothetical protein
VGRVMVDYDRHIKKTLQFLNSAEVNLMRLPESERKRALQLELDMTRAIDRGETETFFGLLGEWRVVLLKGGGDDDLAQKSLFK